MAGRIRSIKPEILEDEKTAELSHIEWRLFVSLFLIADDHGNLRGESSYIRGQCLWATDDTREDVEDALEGLARVSLVSRYTVRGQSYYHIPGWSKHQRVDKPGKARMPGPDEADSESYSSVAADSRDSRETPRNVIETLAPDLRSPTTDQETEPGAERRSKMDARADEIAILAVGEIRRLSGRSFDPHSKSTQKLCRSLARAKRTDEQILLVIRYKADWLKQDHMREHFCPTTLLGPVNFEKYYDQAQSVKARAGPLRVVADDDDPPLGLDLQLRPETA